MDFQTRRTLHDHSLPAIHEAILILSTSPDDAAQQAINTLTEVHNEISNLIHTGPTFPLDTTDSDFFGTMRRSIQNEFAGEFEKIHWQLPEIPPLLGGFVGDVIFGAVREAVRNAAVHGRGNNPKRVLCLWVTIQDGNPLQVNIRDEGIGPDVKTNVPLKGGSGNGLALHGTLMALIGGSMTIEAAEERGTLVQLTL